MNRSPTKGDRTPLIELNTPPAYLIKAVEEKVH